MKPKTIIFLTRIWWNVNQPFMKERKPKQKKESIGLH